MPSAKIYYDQDADPSLLTDKQVVFLGFGNQGAAQAQNLRDSGVPNEKILIANRDDSYAEDAKSKPQQDVVMVAPRMIGSSVRSLFQKGKGFPCFVSVEQDASGSGLAIALALSRAIGATKAGAIASSAREETAMDLLAEQALWPNIIMLFREAFSVLKEAGCSDEALCYEMWMSKEPAEIFERAAEDGFVGQLKHHSIVSQYGQLSGALALDGASSRAHFKDILYNQVLNGKFCRNLSKIEADLELDGLQNPLNELYRRAEETELVQAEKRVRHRLADLLSSQTP
ncbi:IlvN-domain-containing protein [Flammula alnicola]|nr:IlvN-domain-containing protein [Flammula alnicola]